MRVSRIGSRWCRSDASLCSLNFCCSMSACIPANSRVLSCAGGKAWLSDTAFCSVLDWPGDGAASEATFWEISGGDWAAGGSGAEGAGAEGAAAALGPTLVVAATVVAGLGAAGGAVLWATSVGGSVASTDWEGCVGTGMAMAGVGTASKSPGIVSAAANSAS